MTDKVRHSDACAALLAGADFIVWGEHLPVLPIPFYDRSGELVLRKKSVSVPIQVPLTRLGEINEEGISPTELVLRMKTIVCETGMQNPRLFYVDEGSDVTREVPGLSVKGEAIFDASSSLYKLIYHLFEKSLPKGSVHSTVFPTGYQNERLSR